MKKLLLTCAFAIATPHVMASSNDEKIRSEISELGATLEKLGKTIKERSHEQVEFVKKDSKQGFKEIRKKLASLEKEVRESTGELKIDLKKELAKAISNLEEAAAESE